MKAKAEETALKNRELDITEGSNELDNSTKIEIKMMDLIEKRNEINTTDYTEIDSAEMQLKRTKLQSDMDKIVKDYTMSSKQHSETVRHNKATEAIAKAKPTTSAK